MCSTLFVCFSCVGAAMWFLFTTSPICASFSSIFEHRYHYIRSISGFKIYLIMNILGTFDSLVTSIEHVFFLFLFSLTRMFPTLSSTVFGESEVGNWSSSWFRTWYYRSFSSQCSPAWSISASLPSTSLWMHASTRWMTNRWIRRHTLFIRCLVSSSTWKRPFTKNAMKSTCLITRPAISLSAIRLSSTCCSVPSFSIRQMVRDFNRSDF